MINSEQEFLIALGQKIKRLREERQWSQEYLAERCGYTSETRRSSINKIELGKSNTPVSKFKLIANAFGMTAAELLSLNPSDVTQKPPNTCELLEQCHSSEVFTAVRMFVQLDQIDQTKITARMEVMLEDEKYAVKKESKHA